MSDTKIPNEIIIKSNDNVYYIWDCPGFFDTEGVE